MSVVIFHSAPHYFPVACHIQSASSDVYGLQAEISTLAGQQSLLPNSTSWDICRIESIKAEVLSSETVAQIDKMQPGATRIFRVSQQVEDAQERSSLRKSILEETRRELAQLAAKTDFAIKSAELVTEKAVSATKKAESATAMAESATKKAASCQEALLCDWRQRIIHLRKSLVDLNAVLRFELFDRLMKAVDKDVKLHLSADELNLVRAAKCNWVGSFIDFQTCTVPTAITLEVRAVANKAYAVLSREDFALFVYARHVARHVGKEVQHALQHPTPTVEYAKIALATFAAADGSISAECLDLEHAQKVVEMHTMPDRLNMLLFLGAGQDPREEIEDEIARLEYQLTTTDV
ncbi:hypothetical protein B0H16DRAFT_1683495 [Mycena metata]|uniref:Uncharacterized protein n=1 Tax=Mycena metata TaxID=1033252 RepID=A0AAD7K900_9AGAR|nr:hypothetical protein B0H16DRAFT_1683495 [Mycena metata]